MLGFIKEALETAIKGTSGTDGEKIKEALSVIENKAERDTDFHKSLVAKETEWEELHKVRSEIDRARILEEARSEDPYVRRVRPTFLYLFYAIVLVNFVIVPFLQVTHVMTRTIIYPSLPEELYWLFGTAYLGYAGFRSWDKRRRR